MEGNVATIPKKVKTEHLLDFRKPAFAQYAKALGEANLAWNDLHEMLGNVFWSALGIRNGVIPLQIWHSSTLDRAQREMLKAITDSKAIDNVLNEKAKAEILWILSRATALEDMRNNAIHSPVSQSGDKPVEAAHQSGHIRARSLANKDMLKELDYFYQTVITLRTYAFEIFSAIQTRHSTFPTAWPERPKLPNRGGSSEPKPRPPTPQAKRPRQRRSSGK